MVVSGSGGDSVWLVAVVVGDGTVVGSYWWCEETTGGGGK